MPDEIQAKIEISFKDISSFVKLLEAAIEVVQASKTGDVSKTEEALIYLEHCIMEVGID